MSVARPVSTAQLSFLHEMRSGRLERVVVVSNNSRKRSLIGRNETSVPALEDPPCMRAVVILLQSQDRRELTRGIMGVVRYQRQGDKAEEGYVCHFLDNDIVCGGGVFYEGYR